jgi:hypothetical protein
MWGRMTKDEGRRTEGDQAVFLVEEDPYEDTDFSGWGF